MLGITTETGPLELFPDTRIRIVQVSPLFFLGLGHGSYSYEFTIPNTAANQVALGFPGLVTVRSFEKDVPATLTWKGNYLFGGVLNVKGAGGVGTRIKASLFIREGGLARATAGKLSSYNLGGHLVSSATGLNLANDVVAHAKDTALNPTSYDHIFAPVRNPNFTPSPVKSSFYSVHTPYVNYYYNDQFYHAENARTLLGVHTNVELVPFPRLLPLLTRLCQSVGYTILASSWYGDPEMANVVLYNTYAINVFGPNMYFDPYIDYKNHVPASMLGKDFLRNCCLSFGLAPLVNDAARTVRLVPLEEIANDPNVIDWQSITQGYDSSFDDLVSRAWRGGLDETDALHNSENVTEKQPTIVATYWDEGSLPASTGGGDHVYIGRTNKILRDTQGAGWQFVTYRMFPEPGDQDEAEMSGFGTTQMHYYDGAIAWGDLNGRVPHCDQEGAAAWWPETKGAFIPKLMVYRGMRTGNPTYGQYPYLTNDDGDGAGQRSMLWHSKYGLYERGWRVWDEATSGGHPVSFQVLLGFSELLVPQWEKKRLLAIREGNLRGYIRKIETEFRMDGIGTSKVEIIPSRRG